ncbi:hypothetical protein OM33_05030 [Pseudoalteromonas piratica]|uniref:Uncharacterized protein n=2 Tax=Pseudoalteromonas piratica TaxID=1348114 RepID=A0A0A7EDH6_9GAMM|nr:hypothetical protein OM33_05030 [Pseudoalteromonas piratica]
MLSDMNQHEKLKLAGLVIITLVFLKFIVIPWHAWKEETVSDLMHTKQSYRDPSKVIELHEQIKSKLIGIKAKEDKVRALLFDETDTDSLSLAVRSYVESLAKAHGISIKRSVSRGSTDDGLLNKASFQIVFTENREKVESFLSQLEKQEKLLRVEQFNLSRNAMYLQVSVTVSGWSRRKPSE